MFLLGNRSDTQYKKFWLYLKKAMQKKVLQTFQWCHIFVSYRCNFKALSEPSCLNIQDSLVIMKLIQSSETWLSNRPHAWCVLRTEFHLSSNRKMQCHVCVCVTTSSYHIEFIQNRINSNKTSISLYQSTDTH